MNTVQMALFIPRCCCLPLRIVCFIICLLEILLAIWCWCIGETESIVNGVFLSIMALVLLVGTCGRIRALLCGYIGAGCTIIVYHIVYVAAAITAVSSGDSKKKEENPPQLIALLLISIIFRLNYVLIVGRFVSESRTKIPTVQTEASQNATTK